MLQAGGRELLVVGGDLHFGVSSDILQPDARLLLNGSSNGSHGSSAESKDSAASSDDAAETGTGDSTAAAVAAPLPAFSQIIVTAVGNDPPGLRSFEAWRANVAEQSKNVIVSDCQPAMRQLQFRHTGFLHNPNFASIKMSIGVRPDAKASAPSSPAPSAFARPAPRSPQLRRSHATLSVAAAAAGLGFGAGAASPGFGSGSGSGSSSLMRRSSSVVSSSPGSTHTLRGHSEDAVTPVPVHCDPAASGVRIEAWFVHPAVAWWDTHSSRRPVKD